MSGRLPPSFHIRLASQSEGCGAAIKVRSPIQIAALQKAFLNVLQAFTVPKRVSEFTVMPAVRTTR
jgi:hypothetical protein